MGNYFYLELDTTSPFIEIMAPSYTTPQTYVEITIQANETLSTYQEIYAIDSKGVRHDITLNYRYTKFTGTVLFTNMPFGFVTIYARVKDEVGNLSNIAIKSVNLIQSNTLSLEIGAYSNKLLLLNNTGESKVDALYGSTDIDHDIRNLETDWRDSGD